ncbi:MAG: TetR/AcrR family transcriptional regulator [Betaproteobacteria bacterium]
MVRPSQNIDKRLLAAGAELLPATGCKGLSVRQLVEHAGVNLGMFHYHFKSKDNFIRTVLEQTYEEMFSALVLQVSEVHSPLESLRGALRVLGRFGRKNRVLMVTLVSEAMAGEALPAAFLRANLPRHITIIAQLVARAQRDGSIVKAPVPAVLAFLMGSVAAPLLLGSAITRHGVLPPETAALIEKSVLSERALDQRIEFALRGLAADRK